MALSKIQPASMDLTANYAFTGTNSVAGLEYAEKKLSTVTASGDSALSFTSSIDSTYNIYKFRWINIHPSGSGGSGVSDWKVNFRDGGSNFDATKTTTAFGAYHNEAGNDTSLSYNTGADLAQSTSDQILSVHGHVGGGADESCSGEMFLFDPSSTTFVKHFTAVNQNYYNGTYSIVAYVAGYCNTTTAIDGVTFKFTSGNIDSGTIEMYGIN
jgi:hypothetical protein